MIEEILNLARWAPSGDNEQNWRFEIKSLHHLIIHGYQTAEELWLNAEGKASQISLGALLENISLAASSRGIQIHISQVDSPYKIEVWFESSNAITEDPLWKYIKTRQINEMKKKFEK